MNAVTIYAYAPTADKLLSRFAVVDGEFSMSTHDRRPMEATEVASALGVDTATFADCAALLETALREPLDTFNSAHHPARRVGRALDRQSRSGPPPRSCSPQPCRER